MWLVRTGLGEGFDLPLRHSIDPDAALLRPRFSRRSGTFVCACQHGLGLHRPRDRSLMLRSANNHNRFHGARPPGPQGRTFRERGAIGLDVEAPHVAVSASG